MKRGCCRDDGDNDDNDDGSVVDDDGSDGIDGGVQIMVQFC